MEKKYFFILICTGFITLFLSLAQGVGLAEDQTEPFAQVYLKNKDKISGKVISEDDEQIKIEHENLGILSIKKESVENIVFEKEMEPAAAPVVGKKSPWSREIAIGYDKSSGNTENSHFTMI